MTNETAKTLSIIVVSYNTKKMTLACIESVFQQTSRTDFELLVVDNNSSDGSAEAIAETFPEVQLFALKENLGFARANNYAAKYAKGAYLLLLNPDTVVLDESIDKLFTFSSENPQHMLYGGRTLFADLSLNPSSCWGRPTLWSMFCYATGLTSLFRRNDVFDTESYGSWQRDTVKEVDIVSGCFLLIKTSLWKELKGFDREFFMYGEDADLCFRAKKLGAKPIITPDATIIHYCGASEKVRADKMIRLFKAKKQLMKKHWHPIASVVGGWLITGAALSRYLVTTILASLQPDRFAEAHVSWRNIWQGRKGWLFNE